MSRRGLRTRRRLGPLVVTCVAPLLVLSAACTPGATRADRAADTPRSSTHPAAPAAPATPAATEATGKPTGRPTAMATGRAARRESAKAGRHLHPSGTGTPTATASPKATPPSSPKTRERRTLHGEWGETILPDVATGIAATQSVVPDLRLSDPEEVLYAPTMKPTSHACVEVSTVYDSGVPHVGAWNWCGPGADKGFEAWIPVDAAFVRAYTVQSHGQRAYTIRIYRTDVATNEWTVELLNQRTGAWDKVYSSSGSDGGHGDGGGWDMFEIYGKPDASGRTPLCDDIASLTFESREISLLDPSSGDWVAVDARTGPMDDRPNPATEFGCEGLNLATVAPDHWRVVSDTP